MEDYGMCCGPNEARQCSREYYERLELERQQEKIENMKLIICGCIIAFFLVTIPLLITVI